MSDLKPCPFCGGKMDGYPDYTISFKNDRRKIHGIYYKICTLHCNRCTCTIQQAGATNEEAEKHAYNVWNRRVPEAIVRCKDCIHRGIINVCPYTQYVSVGEKTCRGTDTSSTPYDYSTQLVIHCNAEDNDYCSKGERRIDGKVN